MTAPEGVFCVIGILTCAVIASVACAYVFSQIIWFAEVGLRCVLEHKEQNKSKADHDGANGPAKP
jgi:hypothetical protein